MEEKRKIEGKTRGRMRKNFGRRQRPNRSLKHWFGPLFLRPKTGPNRAPCTADEGGRKQGGKPKREKKKGGAQTEEEKRV